MKGYNIDPLKERDLNDVNPLRFTVLVRIHDEAPKSTLLDIPQTAFDLKNHTQGRHGTVLAMGLLAKNSMTTEGLVEVGSHVIFDESVSIDDPNRCFKNHGSVCIMFGVDTILAVLKPLTDGNCTRGLLDRETLCAIGRSLMWVLGDRVVISRPSDGEQVSAGGIILPVGKWLKRIAGIVVPGGRWARHTGGIIEAAGLGVVRGVDESGRPLRPRGMDVKIGDHVLFPKYGHTDINIDGVPCVIIQQDKLLATFIPKEDEVKDYERKGNTVERAVA